MPSNFKFLTETTLTLGNDVAKIKMGDLDLYTVPLSLAMKFMAED